MSRSNWDSYVERLRRRRLSEGMGSKTGLFMSAWKNLEPVFTAMQLEPGSTGGATYDAVMVELRKAIKGSRIGIVSRFAKDILSEVTAVPVTDEQVKDGEKKAHDAHEAKVKQKRVERAAEKAAKASAGAAGPGPAAAGNRDAGAGSAAASGVDGAGETAPEEVVGEEAEEGEEVEEVEEGEAQDEARPPSTRADSHHEEEGVSDMSNENTTIDEEYDDEGDEAEGQGQDDDTPPSRRAAPRARVTQQQQPQIIMVQPQGRNVAARMNRNQPRGLPQSKFVKPQTMVRISKRSSGGKTVFINDYTSDEIGSSLKNFLKEQVDPEYAEPSGQTEYIVSEVFSDGREGAPARFTIASAPQQNAPNGVESMREALDLVNELRSDAREEARANAEVFSTAKKTAAGSSDFGQLFMLMMMEKFMSPKQLDPEQLVKMVAEKLQPAIHAPLPVAAMPNMPMQAPQWLPPPTSQSDDLTKTLLLRALEPKPDPMAEVTKLLLVKAITGEPMGAAGGAHGVTEERLKTLLAQYTAPKAPEAGAIDSALGTFEKLSTMVTTLAPKLNAGGITGALQGILTPDLQKALGDMVAKGVQGAGGLPGLPGTPPGQATVQGQVAKPPQGPPQPQLPPEIQQGLAAIRIAQTREFQLDATANLVTAMYMHPMFQPTFEPALKQLMEGQPRMAQEILVTVLNDAKPALVNAQFIDEVLRVLGKRFGVDVDAVTRAAAEKAVAEKAAAEAEKTNTEKTNVEKEKTNVIPIQRAPGQEAWDAQIETARAKQQAENAAAEKSRAEANAKAQAAVANAATSENAPPAQPLGAQQTEATAPSIPSIPSIPSNVPTTPPEGVPPEPVQVVKFEKEPARPSA